MNTKADPQDLAGAMDHQRMSHALDDFHDPAAQKTIAAKAGQTWNRAMFYLAGGAVAFFALMFLAQSINPPDSALRSEDMMLILGPWDGLWEGKEWRLSLQGEVIEEYDVTMEILSTSATMQSVRVIRTSQLEGTETEFWLNQMTPDGSVLVRAGQDRERYGRFEGTLLESGVVWTRENDEFSEIQRSWTAGNQLHTDTVLIPKQAPGTPILTTGHLRRTEVF